MYNNGKEAIVIARRPAIKWNSHLTIDFLVMSQYIDVLLICQLTANNSIIFWMPSAPIFITWRLTVKWLGILSDDRDW